MDNRPKPPRRYLPLLIAALAVAAVALVIAGRLLDAPSYAGWQDPFYSVLLAFTLDGTFLGPQNIVTLLGAFAAASVFYLALLGGLWVVFRRRVIAWRAARMRRHIVIVGDDADAEELALALAREANVVLVSPRQVEAPRLLSVARPGATSGLIAAANIHRARAVVVMLADDKANAAIATAIASGRDGEADPTIWCRLRDGLIADRVAGVEPGAARILVFDEAQMMARDVFARHPAHAVAERMAAARAHFLIVGFGGLGRAMAEEAVFSGTAFGLDRPMVTVIDKDAARAEALYRAVRPALERAADFAFIPAEMITAENAPVLTAEALAQLAARDDIAPVTGILICLGSDADNVRMALALPDIRRREGRYFAPAFMRLRDPDAESVVFATRQPGVVDPAVGVIPIERPTRLLASDILDAAHRDAAARRLHEAYLASQGRSAGASADWNGLPETYRRANRRSADHIAAKLHALGLTSEHDADVPLAVRRPAHAARLAPLLGAPDAALDALAALEQRRWIADRVLDGWVPAARRDDDRKQHPLLALSGYDALPESERQKDRQQVRTLLGAVPASAGSGVLAELRVALAGHRNLALTEEQRALARLGETLVARLAAPERAVTLVSPLAPGADIAMTESVAAALLGRVGELRLIVPEAVPYRVVLEVAAAETGGDEVARERFIAILLERRRRLFERFARVDIVRIGFAGCTDDSYRRDSAQFERGLARANAYLARRSDLMALLWDGAPGRGLGGTGDLAAYWRDPSSIPPGLDPGPSPLRRVTPDAEDLIVVPVQRN
jgi:hypothetical protein